MAISVQMPALGESVTEGTVTRWLKQEGDTVEQDEPLLEVSTDKVDTEIPSPAAGVLKKIIAQEDDTVEVGGELAVIGDASEDGEASGGQAPAAEETAGRSKKSQPKNPPRSPNRPPRSGRRSRRRNRPSRPRESSGGGQATSVKMPELGESVTEGTVTRWLKKVGDSVEVDEPLVEVSTDKVDTEIPSPVAGTLLSITAEEDDTVAVGGELAKIGEAGAAPAEEPAPKPEAQAGSQGRAEARARSARAQAGTEAREPSPNPSRSPSPNPSRSPSPRPPRRHRPAMAARMSPRWCENWPPRTTLTWRP